MEGASAQMSDEPRAYAGTRLGSLRNETVAKEKSAIEGELSQQASVASYLHEVITNLEDRLNVVRSNMPKSDRLGRDVRPQLGSSSFYIRAWENTETIGSAVERINTLTRELEV